MTNKHESPAAKLTEASPDAEVVDATRLQIAMSPLFYLTVPMNGPESLS